MANTKKQRIKKVLLTLAGIFSLYTSLFLLIQNGTINGYYETILILIGVNIILATSLNLAVGYLGQLALGHAGFMAIGAYTAAICSIKMDLPDNIQLPVSLIIGGIVAGLFGVLIGIPALRLRGDYLGIVTLGFGEIIKVAIFNIEITGGARGLRGIPNLVGFAQIFFIVVIVVAILYMLISSRHGRAIISIREDEIAAEAVGVSTTYYKILGFATSAFFAGIGGGAFAHYMRVLDPKKFNFLYSVEILIIVVLGGMTFKGTIIAAIILTALPELLREIEEYRMLLYSGALVAIMVFKPQINMVAEFLRNKIKRKPKEVEQN